RWRVWCSGGVVIGACGGAVHGPASSLFGLGFGRVDALLTCDDGRADPGGRRCGLRSGSFLPGARISPIAAAVTAASSNSTPDLGRTVAFALRCAAEPAPELTE